jgi:hypothetical protein
MLKADVTQVTAGKPAESFDQPLHHAREAPLVFGALEINAVAGARHDALDRLAYRERHDHQPVNAGRRDPFDIPEEMGPQRS